MAQFPYLPMFVESWRSDTTHLSLAHEGAYWRLLHTMWVTPHCRVPHDVGWLMQHMRITKDEYRDILQPIIAEYCRVDGNWVIQKRLQKEYARVFQTKERLSALGKRRKNNGKSASSTSSA